MQLAQEFEELANTCLLVLHLEVRCMVVKSTDLLYACHLKELAKIFCGYATHLVSCLRRQMTNIPV
jgi:hypothetical protein